MKYAPQLAKTEAVERSLFAMDTGRLYIRFVCTVDQTPARNICRMCVQTLLSQVCIIGPGGLRAPPNVVLQCVAGLEVYAKEIIMIFIFL